MFCTYVGVHFPLQSSQPRIIIIFLSTQLSGCRIGFQTLAAASISSSMCFPPHGKPNLMLGCIRFGLSLEVIYRSLTALASLSVYTVLYAHLVEPNASLAVVGPSSTAYLPPLPPMRCDTGTFVSSDYHIVWEASAYESDSRFFP